MKRCMLFAACLPLLAEIASAHDAWVQTNTNLVRAGDVVHVDLLLGNHGNDHRDFRLAGKVSLQGARMSFIPRGTTLAPGLDQIHERTTDASGEASFTPTFGNYYLVAAHHLDPDDRGKGFDRTKYSATLCVYVPQICPCCSGE